MKILSSQINLSGVGGGSKLSQQNGTQQNQPIKPLPPRLTIPIPNQEQQTTQHNHNHQHYHHQHQRSKSADARPIPDEYKQQLTAAAAGTSKGAGTQNHSPGISKQGSLYYYQSSPYYYYYASSRGGGDNKPMYEYEYENDEVVSMCEPVSLNSLDGDSF